MTPRACALRRTPPPSVWARAGPASNNRAGDKDFCAFVAILKQSKTRVDVQLNQTKALFGGLLESRLNTLLKQRTSKLLDQKFIVLVCLEKIAAAVSRTVLAVTTHPRHLFCSNFNIFVRKTASWFVARLLIQSALKVQQVMQVLRQHVKGALPCSTEQYQLFICIHFCLTHQKRMCVKCFSMCWNISIQTQLRYCPQWITCICSRQKGSTQFLAPTVFSHERLQLTPLSNL